jgi:hypothetical protein
MTIPHTIVLKIGILIDGFGRHFETNILCSVSFAKLYSCGKKAWNINVVPD